MKSRIEVMEKFYKEYPYFIKTYNGKKVCNVKLNMEIRNVELSIIEGGVIKVEILCNNNVKSSFLCDEHTPLKTYKQLKELM